MDDVYKFPWVICIGGTKTQAYNEFARCMGLPKDDEDLGMPDGSFLGNSSVKGGAIWLSSIAKTSTIVHECVHGTNYALQTSGVKPGKQNNDEHYAYYTEWLFKKVYKIWKQSKAPGLKYQ